MIMAGLFLLAPEKGEDFCLQGRTYKKPRVYSSHGTQFYYYNYFFTTAVYQQSRPSCASISSKSAIQKNTTQNLFGKCISDETVKELARSGKAASHLLI